MPGLPILSNIFLEKGEKFMKNILSKRVTVTENMDGSTFYVQRVADSKLEFYKRDDRVPLNRIDRLLIKYYEPAIQYFESLSDIIVDMMPLNWKFSFQYFVNSAPVSIHYDSIPKHNLILTNIIIKNDTGKTVEITDDILKLKEWSYILDVDGPPVIFDGYLNDFQKGKLLDFIKTDNDSLKEIFGTDSFIEYLLKILNPGITKTFLNNDLKKPIDSIIFKFNGDSYTSFSAKIVDSTIKPLIEDTKKRSTTDTYSIILVDILEFFERNPSVINTNLLSTDSDSRYIELISEIFNQYIDKNKKKYEGIDFQTPEFAKKIEFDLNVDKITNSKTRSIVENSDSYKTLYKIFLSTFRKKRKKTNFILTESIIDQINEIITKIKTITDTSVNNDFIGFKEYLNLKEHNEFIYDEEENENIVEVKLPTLNISENVKINLDKSVTPITIEHNTVGENKVNIIVGRFHPFTLGHLKIAQRMYERNGLPSVFVVIRGKKTDTSNKPFSEELQKKMFDSLKEYYSDCIQDIVFLRDSAAINLIVDNLRPNYEPVLWGAGSDRFKTYDNQIKKYSETLNTEELDIFEIERDDTDVSASMVRNYLLSGNKDAFNRLVPECIQNLYDDLRTELSIVKHEKVIEQIKKSHEAYGK